MEAKALYIISRPHKYLQMHLQSICQMRAPVICKHLQLFVHRYFIHHTATLIQYGSQKTLTSQLDLQLVAKLNHVSEGLVQIWAAGLHKIHAK